MAGTLFTNVRVLDCTGADPFPGEVLVDGNRIAGVASGFGLLPRDNVDVIDGGGDTGGRKGGREGFGGGGGGNNGGRKGGA